MLQWDVGDVARPGLVWPCDGDIPQQIGINPVPWGGAAGRSLRAYALEPHQPHKSLSPLPIDCELLAYLPRPVERALEVQLVDLPHQREVLG